MAATGLWLVGRCLIPSPPLGRCNDALPLPKHVIDDDDDTVRIVLVDDDDDARARVLTFSSLRMFKGRNGKRDDEDATDGGTVVCATGAGDRERDLTPRDDDDNGDGDGERLRGVV